MTPRKVPPSRIYLVWTLAGRKYYARATCGFAACATVNAHMTAHGITGDTAANAFAWDDQTVFPVRTTPAKAGVR